MCFSRRCLEQKFPLPLWERGRTERRSPSPQSSSIGDWVAIARSLLRFLFVISSAAGNLRSLTFVRDDNATFGDVRQSLEREHVRNFSSANKVFAGLFVALGVSLGAVAVTCPATPERVRVGYSVGGLIPFPVVVARENNLFEPLGLEIELINIPPTLAVTALVSGDLHYVIFAGTTLNAAVRGLPVKLVMVYNDRPLFSLMSRPEIRSVKEMKGKVLGVASFTSGESFLSRRLLKESGVDPEKEVTLRTIGNTPDRLVG